MSHVLMTKEACLRACLIRGEASKLNHKLWNHLNHMLLSPKYETQDPEALRAGGLKLKKLTIAEPSLAVCVFIFARSVYLCTSSDMHRIHILYV